MDEFFKFAVSVVAGIVAKPDPWQKATPESSRSPGLLLVSVKPKWTNYQILRLLYHSRHSICKREIYCSASFSF